MVVKCPKYTPEFKKRAVDLYHARGGTYAEIAREPGCDAGSVAAWVKKERAGACRRRTTRSSPRRSCGASGARTSGCARRTRHF